MYAMIKVGVDRHDGVLVVPVEALAMEKTKAFIFKVADGKAKKTAVTLGFNDGAKVEVMTGAAENEPVILVVRGLGAATVSVGALALAPESDVLFMLALVLAQRAGERVSRASLRALIWPGASEQSARHTLRQAAWK